MWEWVTFELTFGTFAFRMPYLCVHRGRPPHWVPERGVVTDGSKSGGCMAGYIMSDQSPSRYAEAVSHSSFRREVVGELV